MEGGIEYALIGVLIPVDIGRCVGAEVACLYSDIKNQLVLATQ
jgi:hypothetical protein